MYTVETNSDSVYPCTCTSTYLHVHCTCIRTCILINVCTCTCRSHQVPVLQQRSGEVRNLCTCTCTWVYTVHTRMYMMHMYFWHSAELICSATTQCAGSVLWHAVYTRASCTGAYLVHFPFLCIPMMEQREWACSTGGSLNSEHLSSIISCTRKTTLPKKYKDS